VLLDITRRVQLMLVLYVQPLDTMLVVVHHAFSAQLGPLHQEQLTRVLIVHQEHMQMLELGKFTLTFTLFIFIFAN
jgi:hypothetical protein